MVDKEKTLTNEYNNAQINNAEFETLANYIMNILDNLLEKIKVQNAEA